MKRLKISFKLIFSSELNTCGTKYICLSTCITYPLLGPSYPWSPKRFLFSQNNRMKHEMHCTSIVFKCDINIRCAIKSFRYQYFVKLSFTLISKLHVRLIMYDLALATDSILRHLIINFGLSRKLQGIDYFTNL